MPGRTASALVALAWAAACGGDPAPPAAVARPAPSVSVSAPRSPDDLVADAASDDATPPASSLRRADIVTSYDEAPLFADEIARLDEVARDIMAAQHLPSIAVLSREEHAELEALFSAGRLRNGGPVCALPPSRARIANANIGGLGFALRFACSETATCDVRAEVVDGGGPPTRFAYPPQLDDWSPVVRAKVTVARGGDVAAIERSLRAAPVEPFEGAKRADPPRSAPIRRLGHRTVAIRIAAGWSTAPTAADLASIQPAVDACVTTRGLPVNVLLAVAPAGSVARCESTDRNDDSLAACTCRALATLAFGAAPEGRRLLLSVDATVAKEARPMPTHAAAPSSRTKVDVSADAPENSLPEDWEYSDSINDAIGALAACFSPLPAPRHDEAGLALDVDEAGFATKAAWTDTTWMTDAQRACAQKVSEGMKLQAPLVDAERHLKVVVSFRR